MIKAGTILQDRYLIENQIGTGGMGRVYLAIDQRFENRVAIKETFYKDDGLREAFEREAKLLNGLHHPVLPHVSDYFTEGNEYFLVMEYIEGDDLYEILKREGAFPVEKVVRWSNQMLDALDYLHSQNPPIIHRDIKPQNLKITPRGDIILLDFGLAKLNSEDTTGAVSVFGYSKAYSPLEQIQGTGTDPRSDIFALAATVFHLLTGVLPVDVLSRAAAIIGGKADPLQSADELRPEIPKNVAQILQKALSLNPSERFASAQAAQAALESAMTEDAFISKENDVAPVTNSFQNNSRESVESFPALQAFADNTANSSSKAIESKGNSFQNSKSLEQIPPTVISPQTTATSDDFAQTRRKNLSWMLIGVLAAFLFGGGLVIWQFAGKSEASGEVIPTTSIADSAPQTQIISESPKPENSEAVPENNAKQADLPKANSIVENAPADIKKPSESRPTISRTETTTKPKADSKQNQSVESRNSIERPRVVNEKPRPNDETPVPDIERIFTGQSRQERAEQQRRRAEREEQRERRRKRWMRERMEDDNWELPPPRRRSRRNN